MVSVIMDASPVQSSSKCGSSDFSIERLLSDDKKNSREESVEVPDWLCCTRYRPPRLPRGPTVCRARRAGRHARVPFTAAQASALEAAYSRAPYLAPPALRALAAALQLRDDRIKIWFQNRRARERRAKSVHITPPNAITLPPTTLVSTFPSNSWIPHTRLPRNNEIMNDSLRHDGVNIYANMQNLGEIHSGRFANSPKSPSFFHSYKDSDDDRSDDGPLDVEVVED